eukprot:TRINITY_DN10191_c0_g1_i1.p1 TRINITY_DN10191_c0_g1~~TRINITY_DN10191_c0_g1_i1.p1  ORF type:complete len:1069 (+),score=178.29 TRINITY_DN10191_c0_g1_i1:40-3207(+)
MVEEAEGVTNLFHGEMYSIVSLHGQQAQTRCVPATASPVWNEMVAFHIEGLEGVITVDLLNRDDDGTEIVGRAFVPLQDIVVGRMQQKWFPLDGGGSLLLKVVVKSASENPPDSSASYSIPPFRSLAPGTALEPSRSPSPSPNPAKLLSFSPRPVVSPATGSGPTAKSNLLQHEEVTLQEFPNIAARVAADRDRLHARNEQGMDMLEHLDTSAPGHSGYTTRQLVQEEHLAVPEHEAQGLLQPSRRSAPANVSSHPADNRPRESSTPVGGIPIGVGSVNLVVTVREARNLVRADGAGLTDPYVLLAVGRRAQVTTVKPNTPHPIWNERFVFSVTPDPAGKFPRLVLAVYDKDFKSSESMGTGSLDLPQNLAPSAPFDRWVPLMLKGREAGEIRVCVEPAAEDTASRYAELENAGPTHFVVTIKEGQDLRTTEYDSVYDPLVHISLDDRHNKATTVKRNTDLPVWNESFVFPIEFARPGNLLTVSVFDGEYTAPMQAMGIGTVLVPQLGTSPSDVWVPLTLDGRSAGKLLVNLSFQGSAARAAPSPFAPVSSPTPTPQPARIETAATDPGAVKAALDALLQPMSQPGRPEAVIEDLRRYSNTNYTGLEAMPDISWELASLLQGDLGSVAQVKDWLASTDAKLMEYLHWAEEAHSAKQLAIRERHMDQAERWHGEMLRHLQNALDLVTQRLGAVKEGGPQRVLSRLEDLEGRAHRVLAAATPKVKNLKERVADDQRKLAKRKDGDRQQLEDAMVKHRASQGASKEKLRQNMSEQNRVWQDIVGLMAKLKTLGEERWDEITRSCQENEQHAKQMQDWVDSSRTIERHLAALDDVAREAAAMEDVIKSYEDYIQGVGDRCRTQSDSAKHRLQEVQLQEQQRHLDVFRRYYIAAAELMCKKQARVTEIDHLVRLLDHNIQTAEKTLDPQGNKYESMKNDLERERREAAHKVDVLRDNATKATDDFQETEKALTEAGISFESPLEEAHRQNVGLLHDVLQARRNLLLQDQRQLDTTTRELEVTAEPAGGSPRSSSPQLTGRSGPGAWRPLDPTTTNTGKPR